MALKYLFFSKYFNKSHSGWGKTFRPPYLLAAGAPPVRDTLWDKLLIHVSQFNHSTFGLGDLSINKILITCQTQAKASDLPFYNIFVSKNVRLSKISDDVIACDLWFGVPSQSKIVTTPMLVRSVVRDSRQM